MPLIGYFKNIFQLIMQEIFSDILCGFTIMYNRIMTQRCVVSNAELFSQTAWSNLVTFVSFNIHFSSSVYLFCVEGDTIKIRF